MELGGEMAVPAEEMTFDGLPLATGSLLAVWSRKSSIGPFIEELAAAGVEPEIVTCSMLHWNYLLPQDADTPSVVTDGNALMIGTVAGPLQVRALPASQDDRELSRTVSAFEIANNTAVPGIFRIGDETGRTDQLPLTAEHLDAFGGDVMAARDMAGAYAVASACAAGTIVNFRSGSLAYTAGQEKNLRRLRLTAILAASLVLLLFAEVGLRYFLVRRDLASLDASITTSYREIFPSRKKSPDAVGEVRSEIKRLSGSGGSQRVLPALKKVTRYRGSMKPRSKG
jgi:general secretion pathway protein L